MGFLETLSCFRTKAKKGVSLSLSLRCRSRDTPINDAAKNSERFLSHVCQLIWHNIRVVPIDVKASEREGEKNILVYFDLGV